MWVIPSLVVNAVVAFITLVVACMLTVGFSIFCDGLLKNQPDDLE